MRDTDNRGRPVTRARVIVLVTMTALLAGLMVGNKTEAWGATAPRQTVAPAASGKSCPPECSPSWPGVRKAWCTHNPQACQKVVDRARKTYRNIHNRQRDTVRFRTFKQHVRGQINRAMTVNPKGTMKDNGGYGDWAGPADCTIHGYECYGTANSQNFTTADKVIVGCAAGVAVVVLKVRIVGGTVAKASGDAADRCLTGMAAFFGWLWAH